jgi:1,4-alpha-glucan branching enzyme
MENYTQEVQQFLKGQSGTAYRAFGAHPVEMYGKQGIFFSIYAPYAASVDLIGAFNDWNGWNMQRDEYGVWSIFCENIPFGSLYKYRMTTSGGEVFDRADPFAFYSELRPGTASIVWDISPFAWSDSEWMASRSKNYTQPVNIYEVHAGSWRRIQEGRENAPTEEEREFGRMLTYSELADVLIPYVQEAGYTHIELMPLTEHPFDGSWGYQATGYFSPTSRYGTPDDLCSFVDRCHQAGIGVILDVVPLHFVTDFFGLHQLDGGFVYESANPSDRYTEWGTVLFDYTKPHTLSFMRSSLDFWLRVYHIDGLRYDAVSQLIFQHGNPHERENDPGIWFLKNVNFYLQSEFPSVMLMAEDSSNYLKVTAPVQYGGLGFDYKWDLGWMNDTLEYMKLHPDDRRHSRHLIQFSMAYFYNDIFILPLSHDEVVHGKATIIDKMWGNYEQKFSQVRLLYLYMYAHPGKKLNFMGNELAEFREWDEKKELGWNLLTYPVHDAFHHFLIELNHLGLTEKALYDTEYDPRDFRWLDTPGCEDNVFAIARRAQNGETIACVMNFGLRPVQTTIPALYGTWEELINTDDSRFSGSGEYGAPVKNGLVRVAPLSGRLFKQK